MSEKQFVVTWKIENFLFAPQTFGEAIESPPFIVKTISNCKWVLLIYPAGYKDMYKEEIVYSLKFQQPNKNLIKSNMNFNIDILKEDGSILHSCCKENWLDALFEFDSFVLKISDLENEMKHRYSDDLILRCHIYCNKKIQKHEAMKCDVATEIVVDCATFTGNVRSPCTEKWSEVITFCIPGTAQFKVTLTATIPEEYILINIICTDQPAWLPKIVKFELVFLDRNEIIIDSNKEWHSFNAKDGPSWNLPNFIKKKQLQFNIKGLMFYDFIIKGKVTVSNGTTTEKGTKYTYFFSSPLSKMVTCLEETTFDNNYKSIQSNFRDLLISKKHFDVTLRIGNDEFQAHKLVLIARSSVFSVMFDQDMSESKTGIVDIHDVDSEIMKIFLEYLYTDLVHNMDYKVAKRLLLVADKYEVVSLKEKCAVYLKSVLSASNACDVAIISDMIRDDSLKKVAVNIIKENAHSILSSPDWLDFIKIKPELTTEIFLALSNNFRSSKNKN